MIMLDLVLSWVKLKWGTSVGDFINLVKTLAKKLSNLIIRKLEDGPPERKRLKVEEDDEVAIL